MADAVKKAETLFDGKPHMVVTPNPEIILECKNDEELKNIINSSDLVLPDGIGVVIASNSGSTEIVEDEDENTFVRVYALEAASSMENEYRYVQK